MLDRSVPTGKDNQAYWRGDAWSPRDRKLNGGQSFAAGVHGTRNPGKERRVEEGRGSWRRPSSPKRGLALGREVQNT